MDGAAKLASLLGQLNTVIVGKEAQVRDCVACLLAGGHLLIEDVPGVGKTTLAHLMLAAIRVCEIPGFPHVVSCFTIRHRISVTFLAWT